MNQPFAPAVSVPARDELRALLFDGKFERFHKDVRELFQHEIFRHRDNLSAVQACDLAYARARFLNQHLESATEIIDNPHRLFALHEWAALCDTSLLGIITMHYNLVLGSILEFGRGRDDLQDYLDELESMSAAGSYLATELGYGNNVVGLQTEAVYDRATREFVLNTPSAAAQKFPQNTGQPGQAKLAIVFARLKVDGHDHGVFPFIVRLRDEHGVCEGVRITRLPDKPGVILDSGVTSFHDVRLPHRNLLSGEFGELSEEGTFSSPFASRRQRFLAALDRLQSGKICLAASAVGATRAALYITTKYSLYRKTFAPGVPDVPIIAYRSHQVALFGGLATMYAMTLLVNHTKNAYVGRTKDNEVEVNRLIAITKAAVTWRASEVLEMCRERCGAQGIFSANRIIDYILGAKVLVTVEGDNVVIMIKAAREMLTGEGYVAPTVDSLDPSEGDLLDPARWPMLFAHRERRLHTEVTGSVAERMGRGESLFEAWNNNLNTALAMVDAHATRLALEQLAAALRRIVDPTAKDVLRALAALYALREIDKESGWFLAQGLLTAEQVRGLPAMIDTLCVDLEPYALTLVEAFGITDQVLDVPIAREDYIERFDFRAQTQ